MDQSKFNIVLIGVSFFDGMAPSTRVKNLLQPLIDKNYINVNNLVYEKESEGIPFNSGAINNINYQIIGFKKSNPFSVVSYFQKGIKFLTKSKSQTSKNIVYNYGYPDIKNILFLLYAKFSGYKIVLDIVEDDRYYMGPQRLLTKIKIKSSLFLINCSHYLVNAIITISSHLNQLMVQASKGKLPVHLIPITVNLSNFHKNDYQVPNHFKIFYGGSFAEKDGLEYLIRAFNEIAEKYENVSLFLTGRGSDHAIKEINRLTANSPAKNRIIFKGYLEPQEYYNLLNECDIFCMTRINSQFANAGFPFKLGEFLATGKAVVATNVGDVSQYLFNNINSLLINAGSVDDIVDGIKSLIENPQKIISLGKEARNTAEKCFDTQKISLKVLEIFREI